MTQTLPRSALLLLGLALVIYTANAAPSTPRVHLERTTSLSIRDGWVLHGTPPTDHSLDIIVAVKQSNVKTLESLFHQVSNPDSAQYKQYLTLPELRRLVRPEPARLRAVLDFIKGARLTVRRLNKAGDFVMVSAPVKHLETAFQVKIESFRHAVTGRVIHITRDPLTLPAGVAEHIDFVAGLSRFPRVKLNSQQRMKAYFESLAPRERELRAKHNGKAEGVTPSKIEYVFMGDQQLTAFVQVLCPCTGAVPDFSGTDATCDGTPLSLQLTGDQGVGGGYNSQQVATVPSAQCKSCAQWTGAAASVCSNKNLPSTEIFCEILLPTHSFALKNYLETTVSVSTQCNGTAAPPAQYAGKVFPSPWVMPKVIRQLYNIPEGIYGVQPNNSQAVVEFQGQYYAPADLNSFEDDMGLRRTNVTLVGPNDPTQPGGESTLDIEYILAVSPKVPTTFWSVEDPNWPDCLVAWAVAVLDAESPIWVHSISYGDIESTYSSNVTTRMNTEFQKMATVGMSVLVATGDNGVADEAPSNSTTCKPFNPDFPSSSPYVTAVSATQLSTQTSPICNSKSISMATTSCDITGEIVSSADTGSVITTGGGFSQAFPAEPYQQSFIAEYLNNPAVTLPPSTGYYNPKGRGIPDVAALGHNFVVNQGQSYGRADGTSAATPVFAGVLALLNDMLIGLGQGPIGFANPLLYKMAAERPSTFNDITMGSNKCNVYYFPQCCEYGFHASAGWDATTGLGTPNFNEMVNYIQAAVPSPVAKVISESEAQSSTKTKIVQK